MDKLKRWLALHKTGSLKLQKLVFELGFEAVININKQELMALGIKASAIHTLYQPETKLIEQDLHWLAQNSLHHILCWDDPHYPPQLKTLYDPPSLLYIKGNPSLLAEAQIAIVGSRNPSPMGLELAQQFSAELSALGLLITSGLALGIDAASHQAALDNKLPTLAVLGSGHAHIYPRRNQKLADIIAENGALISEYAPYARPLTHHFPQRNRLISGLSHGVLVIEATCKSGSLITARLASEQGREVFAIPGSPHHALAGGCNLLIQQGAKLVTCSADLVEELRAYWQPNTNLTDGLTHQFNELELDSRQQLLLQCTGFELSSIDQIVSRSGLKAEQVAASLVELELKGYLKASNGGYIRNLAHSRAKLRLTDRE